MNPNPIVGHPKVFDKLRPELVVRVIKALRKRLFPLKPEAKEDQERQERSQDDR